MNKNIQDMAFTFMYLGPTFASFENLGIETGQVLAMLTDALYV